MKGHLLLEGGGEFGGGMREAYARALAGLGGASAPVRIVAAAAAPDGNHLRAGGIGERWFAGLGASDVRATGVIDPATAGRSDCVAELAAARLIYLLGGFPGHLARTLAGSRAWESVLTALSSGALLAGSSAGAMVLCSRFYDPAAGGVALGLGLVSGACVIPHHERFASSWAPRLSKALPEALVVGIDEETGLRFDGPTGSWEVCGRGAVTVYRSKGRRVHGPGSRVALPGVAVSAAGPA